MADDQPTRLDAEYRQRLMEALAKRLPLNVPKIETSPPQVKGDAAGLEASALAEGKLEAASAAREHSRTERFRDDVALAIRIVFWIGFCAIIFAGLLWGINFIVPTDHRFLTSDQSETILSFLTGSGLTGFIGNYARKRLT